jgi:hypothetical protein
VGRGDLPHRSQGTSAQVVQNGAQKLYFNKCGEKASFIGQRLSDNRKERGVAVEGEMSKEEKQQVHTFSSLVSPGLSHTLTRRASVCPIQNMIMVIQVPLKQKQQNRAYAYVISRALVMMGLTLDSALISPRLRVAVRASAGVQIRAGHSGDADGVDG